MPSRRDGVLLAVLLAAAAGLCVLRWAGPEPFGSDNDEYRLLARALWEDRSLLIAGVEGSKYPVGYSLVLGALDQVGLPLTRTALVLNGLLVGVLVALTYVVGRRLGTLPALAASGVLLLSPQLWDGFYRVMPEVALTVVVLGGFAWLLRTPSRYDVLALCAFAAAATLLKTLGVTLGVALGAALLARRGQRWWAFAPPLAAVLVAGLQSLAARRYPESVTGYAQTFWQLDPADGSRGRIGLADLPARMWDTLPQALAEPGHALLGRSIPSWLATLAVLALLVAAGAAYRAWRLPLLGFWLSHTVLLSAWNFRSDRFGLPLVPVAALGVAALVAALVLGLSRVAKPRTATVGAGVVVAAALAAYAFAAVPVIERQARVDEASFGRFAQATAELDAWAERGIPAEDDIASLDYRELAYRLDRPVLPIGYTRDPQALLEQTAGAGAEWLVTLRGLYGRREGVADTVVGAYPERFARVWSNGTIDVYEISGGSS